MGYILLNQDNTVNYIDDHPIKEKLSFENVRLVEILDQTASEIQGDIKAGEAYWDGKKVVRDPWIVENELVKEKNSALQSTGCYGMIRSERIAKIIK